MSFSLGGYPQGGLCSAKFWIITYNKVLLILNKHGIVGLCLADDSLALRGGKNFHLFFRNSYDLQKNCPDHEQTTKSSNRTKRLGYNMGA